jgi:ATP-binding cassette subfamily B protein
MLRLTRFLKPYLAMIVFAILLLFVQANADLALPDYMSRIVNNGIQQDGVESPLPTALRQKTLERVLLFIPEADQARLRGDFTLVESSSPDYPALAKRYPNLDGAGVYTLNALSADERTWLEALISRGLLAVTGIEQMVADPTKAAEAAKAFGGGFDLSKLPEGTDIFKLLSQIPGAQREQLQEKMTAQFAALGETMLKQAAIGAVKSEYEAMGMDLEALRTAYIMRTGGTMLLITLLSAACTIAVGYFAARTSAGSARDIRRAVFHKVENFSNAEFDHFSTASLITRTTNDITQVQMVVFMLIRMVVYAPIMGVGGIIRAINKDSQMWWIIALGVVLLLSLVAIVFSLSLPKFKIMQKLVDRLNLVVRENLTGMMVIRAFNMQPFEENRFEKANCELTDTTLFIGRVMATMFPSMTMIMSGLSLLIIWIGSHQVAAAQMQVGDMMAFLQYTMQIVFSFLMMSFMFIMIPRASVSGARISEVLATEIEISDPIQPQTFPQPFRGQIEFRNVSFRYPHAEEDVLRDINFTAHPGHVTALIGSTGSGKSTVVNLIPRFYDVSSGAILIDGIDIRAVNQHDLREHIGYIPQRSILFSGTIESNLRYANENAGQELLHEAVETAQASDFISSNAEGMAAEISQGGANISGGQKQRLAIARALVKRAPIYIFDDSFSALDFKTDAALRRALKERMAQGSTLLIVTQRVSTIKQADQIIVLDNGVIVGKGTHNELMAGCEIYREIALSQLTMEELA